MNELKGNIDGFELVVKYPHEILIENNVDELVDFITKRMSDYTPASYMGDADMAKKDRAELNKGIDQVATIRKNIASLNPYKVYTDKLMSAEKLMKAGSDALSEIVNVKTEEEKAIKHKKIKELWEGKNFDTVPLHKIFNQKWLNKTYKIKDIDVELDEAIAKIHKDLKAIDAIGVDADVVKSVYLEKLDLGEAYDYAEQLEKNRQLAKKEAGERVEREKNEQLEKQAISENNEQVILNNSKSMEAIIREALELDDTEPKDDSAEYVLSFIANKEQLLALKRWLTENRIIYNSCEEVEF